MTYKLSNLTSNAIVDWKPMKFENEICQFEIPPVQLCSEHTVAFLSDTSNNRKVGSELQYSSFDVTKGMYCNFSELFRKVLPNPRKIRI